MNPDVIWSKVQIPEEDIVILKQLFNAPTHSILAVKLMPDVQLDTVNTVPLKNRMVAIQRLVENGLIRLDYRKPKMNIELNSGPEIAQTHHALGICDKRRAELLQKFPLGCEKVTGHDAMRQLQKVIAQCHSLEEVVLVSYTFGGFIERHRGPTTMQ